MEINVRHRELNRDTVTHFTTNCTLYCLSIYSCFFVSLVVSTISLPGKVHLHILFVIYAYMVHSKLPY